jgi:hypothetical protein
MAAAASRGRHAVTEQGHRNALRIARAVAVVASIPLGWLTAEILKFLYFAIAEPPQILLLRIVCTAAICLLLSFRLWSHDAGRENAILRFYVVLGSLTIGAGAGLISGYLMFFGPALKDPDEMAWWGWIGGMLALPCGLLIGWASALLSHTALSKIFKPA